MHSAILVAFCLLAFAAAAATPAGAQECEDCKIIKKGVPEVTPGTVAPARPTPGARATPRASATSEPAHAATLPVVEPTPVPPIVRAVLYWAEGCGHCHEVLDGILPRLQQAYGSRLEVRRIEVLTMEDITAFFDVAEAYGFARGEAEVPFLLVGEHALTGVDQISAEFPGLIETYLAGGGVDWPALPMQGAGSRALAAADDGCDFTAPCGDEATVSVTEPTVPAMPASEIQAAGRLLAIAQSPGIPTPALAVGLAAVIVGGLAGALRVRALRRRRAPLLPDDSLEHTTGENDAV